VNGPDTTQRTIEGIARDSYGRLVAYLAARLRDVAAAEDALGDAFVAALATWPRDGLPDQPEAWLLTVARNRMLARLRHERSSAAAYERVLELITERAERAASGTTFPDERLQLMFVSAHPAIDPSVRTPLVLQTVLGLDAAAIARAFLVAPSAMGQRLVRAKQKIRQAGIDFELPEEHELPERLEAVLEAIYAVYGSGWEDAAGADPRARGLAHEALWLARCVTQLLPNEPEASGLLALLLHCEARRPARRTVDGRYVPLSEQDPALWCASMMAEAEEQLERAHRQGRIGRFQLEAAIQSVHAERSRSGRTDWPAVATFYEALVARAPTLGALVGRAAAVAEVHGAAVGLARLDEIEPAAVVAYQPFWAVRAHLLARSGLVPEAQVAFERAIGLAEDPALRRFLIERSR
jgi:predicted RNA polymerase sigma factor